jgi:urea transport system substrate-binding protein
MRSNVAGHMVAWNYLHAFDRKENRAFIADWRRFTGQPKPMTNDSMEATWIGFHLWTEAVEAAGTTDIDKVRAALGGPARSRRRAASTSRWTARPITCSSR